MSFIICARTSLPILYSSLNRLPLEESSIFPGSCRIRREKGIKRQNELDLIDVLQKVIEQDSCTIFITYHCFSCSLWLRSTATHGVYFILFIESNPIVRITPSRSNNKEANKLIDAECNEGKAETIEGRILYWMFASVA